MTDVQKMMFSALIQTQTQWWSGNCRAAFLHPDHSTFFHLFSHCYSDGVHQMIADISSHCSHLTPTCSCCFLPGNNLFQSQLPSLSYILLPAPPCVAWLLQLNGFSNLPGSLLPTWPGYTLLSAIFSNFWLLMLSQTFWQWLKNTAHIETQTSLYFYLWKDLDITYCPAFSA